MMLQPYLLLCFLSAIQAIDLGDYAQEIKPQCKYNHDTRTYYCTNIFDQFPREKYSNFNLKCEECYIKIFTKETFPHPNYLISFNASSSGIENITENAFSTLQSLHYIYLQHNNIVNISENAFHGLRQIYEINIGHNELEELNNGFLNGFEANTLILSHNRLKTIPKEVFKGIYGLMSLYLSHNKINVLQMDSFKYLNGLEVLFLDHNSLCHLPFGLFKDVTTLKLINLSGNNFRKFAPGAFSGLKNLVNLNLSHNIFEEFDSTILLPMDKLTSLDISSNSLFYLDYMSVHVSAPSLKHISIKDNLWSCDFLVTMVRYFRSKNIDPSEHVNGRFEVPNVNGIMCTDKVIQQKISFEHYMKIVDYYKKDFIEYCPS